MAKHSSAKKLRILHVAKWYPNRNDVQNGVFVQKHVAATATFAEVKVLAWLPGSGQTETIESHENGLAITRTYFKPRTAIAVKRHAFLQYIHSHYNNKNLPQLIHLHVFSPDLLVIVLWAKKNKIPVVISEHWSGYLRGIFEGLPQWRKWAYRRLAKVARVLPVSAYLQGNMQRCGLAGNYAIVPNVVDIDYPQAEKLPGYNFVMVADLVDEIKNISGAISAFEVVNQNHPNTRLHLIGGGPDEEKIRERVEKSPAKAAIKRYGRLANAEVKKLLPQFQCLILNSRVETFGVVVLEAHAAGLPVIATRCGGPEEWMEEGDLIIPVNDNAALANAMKAMVSNLNQPHDFKKQEQCTPKNIAQQLKEVYTKVLDEHGQKIERKIKQKK